jgi:hypothetical protein
VVALRAVPHRSGHPGSGQLCTQVTGSATSNRMFEHVANDLTVPARDPRPPCAYQGILVLDQGRENQRLALALEEQLARHSLARIRAEEQEVPIRQPHRPAEHEPIGLP